MLILLDRVDCLLPMTSNLYIISNAPTYFYHQFFRLSSFLNSKMTNGIFQLSFFIFWNSLIDDQQVNIHLIHSNKDEYPNLNMLQLYLAPSSEEIEANTDIFLICC